jgi:membrane protein DedA with SNARE-associated domain
MHGGDDSQMFDRLTEAVTSGPLAYLVVLLASSGDVLFPPVPSETIVVTAGVAAAKGDLDVLLVIPTAAVGAFLGDNVSYWLGRGVGDSVGERLFRGAKARARLDWTERAIQRHGAMLILVGRFIPGGRTASTFAAGALRMPWRRFALADLISVALWATYATMLGYLGGAAFRDSTWKPLAASLGAATLIGVAIEGWRRLQKHRGRDILGDPIDEGG